MDVSSQEAQASLGLIEDTQAKWQKAIGASYASSLFVLWGAIWIIGCVCLHFSYRIGGYVFTALDIAGIAGTLLIARRWPCRSVIKSPEAKAMLWSIAGMWASLLAYAVIWIVLLWPVGGKKLGVFLLTVCMLGYVMTGLWFKHLFIIELGLAVTGMTLAGYYLLPDYFYLWAALTGGGTVLGTGFYIRRWR